MQFSTDIQTRFKEAGWKSGRDVSNAMIYPYDDYPATLTAFVNEYGGLSLPYTNDDEEPIPIMTIDPTLEGDDRLDYYYRLLRRRLYPIAYLMPDAFFICADSDGYVYKAGDYCYCIGSSLEEGLSNLFHNRIKLYLELLEDRAEWKSLVGGIVRLGKHSFKTD